MHIISDSDPLLRSRPFNPVSGSAITVGNIAKIAAAVAESNERLAKLACDLDAKVADLEQRINAQVAKVREIIADADRRDAAPRRRS